MEPNSPQIVPSVPITSVPTYYNNYDYINEPEQGGFLEYWHIIRRRKGKLFVITVSALTASVIITLQQMPVYQARTSLEIQDINPDFMNIRQVNPIAEGAGTTAANDIQTQIKILQSDSLLNKVTQKLAKMPPQALDAAQKQTPPRGGIFGTKRISARTGPQQVALNIRPKDVKVRLAGQTRIVEVLVDSPNPELATAFANSLAAQYIEENIESRWQMAQRTSEGLRHELEDIRIQLERSEGALQQYSRQAGLVITSETDNLSEVKLQQLQAEMVKAQDDRIAKQSRFNRTRVTPLDALPDVLNDTVLQALQATLTDLRRQYAQLSTLYTPEHAKLRQVQAQIAEVQSAMDRKRLEVLTRIRNEYEEALSREDLVTGAYTRQTREVTREARSRIQYNMLKREVDSNHQLYEAMLQRVKEAGVASALKASQVRVLDAARVPEAPYKPKLLLNASLGLSTGLLVGVAFIVMHGRSDRTLRAPGEIESYVRMPELGVIPSITEDVSKWFGSGGLCKALTLRGRSQQRSRIGESFRSLLISILFASRGKRPQVLVIASAISGEGKTTVACNLAIALADLGQRVLLIDGDMRRPSLNNIFNLNNERGLSTLLQDKELNGTEDLVQQAAVERLYVLPAGPPTSAASSLLYSSVLLENSNAILKILQHFRAKFQFLLIDTPPLLYTSDARILGRAADAVLLIARAGRTTRDLAQAAHKRLSDGGALVLGAVLNDWNPKSAFSGSYGDYEKYYGADHSARSYSSK